MLKQALYIFILLIASASAPICAFASDDPFVVEGVEVYAESDTLDNAKRDAVNKGTVEAFDTLLKRLMPSSMHWKIDNVKKDQVFDLVKETKVIKERMTSKTYMATISITFANDGIKNILNRMGANYAEEYAISTLVIPILQVEEEYYIWGDNDWAKAWGQMPISLGLSKFSYAMGDLEDDADVDQLQVMKEPITHYKRLLHKYNADQIMFIMVKELNTAFDVKIRIISLDDDVTLHSLQKISGKQDKPELYKNLGMNLLTKVDDYYKGINPFDESRTFRTRMIVPIKAPKDWSIIRAKLVNIDEVEDVQTIRTTNEYIEIDLLYKVEPLDMSAALAKHDFEVSEEGDTQYLKELKSK
jgi:hypothetical protein